MTSRVGLIGHPIEHSLSPAFQQAAFDALGIAARYELWPTSEGELPARIERLRTPGTLGANVTLPHKEAAFRLVDETSERASEAEAVNTIINRAGRLIGDNTDIPGFLTPLSQHGAIPAEARAVVLGAGGAARAVIVALLSAGCRDITVANRTTGRAETLVAALGTSPAIRVSPLDVALAAWLARATLLVNATPVGWHGSALPLDAALLDALPTGALVYDLIYRETALLRAAEARGLATLDGLRMLVHQGAESFRLWTGRQPPLDLMWQVAIDTRAALG